MAALMIQGVSSWAGKSLLTTALARALKRRGVDVVPFKAMNMSNNARVAADGELGTAQYLQALAAGLEPDVRMNPVLIKPEADDQSQVVVLGKADPELSRMSWRERTPQLRKAIDLALDSLLATHALVLIEGAGSPAEINLRDTDLANMYTATAADARVVLVADIDRGGAFAHLYGTWALLPPAERGLIAGFVLNKFRGDEALLEPGPGRLEQLTGVPTLGVLPWLHHRLPDEDGATLAPANHDRLVVAIVRYPTASNLDEFKALEQHATVRWATSAPDIEDAWLVVLPGSKHVAADLRWLRATSLPAAIRGRRVLAICGGLQMIGERIDDQEGLGLLPLATTFAAPKRTVRTATRFNTMTGSWAALEGLPLDGYEIRHGRTRPTAEVDEALPGGLGYVRGDTLGIYLHGFFEQPELVEALFGARPQRSLANVFDDLADVVEERIDVGTLLELVR